MSIGLYEHPHFGLVRRQILNNKYILEAHYDYSHYRNWASRFEKFQSTYLKHKEQIQFVVFPEEIFYNSDRQPKEEGQVSQSSQSSEQKIIALYQHYPLTLGEELRYRIKNRDPFTLQELWYILYCLIQAAQQLTQIHSMFNPDLPLVFQPDSILLNELGFLKALCFYSSPKSTVRNNHFQTPTEEDKPGFKKFLLESTFATGRIMASLLLFKQLRQFERQGVFDKLAFDREFTLMRGKFGILGNIVLGMLQGIPQQRILLHEIAALLYPYEQCMMSLQGFRLDRKLCCQSMVNILLNKD